MVKYYRCTIMDYNQLVVFNDIWFSYGAIELELSHMLCHTSTLFLFCSNCLWVGLFLHFKIYLVKFIIQVFYINFIGIGSASIYSIIDYSSFTSSYNLYLYYLMEDLNHYVPYYFYVSTMLTKNYIFYHTNMHLFLITLLTGHVSKIFPPF